VHLELAPVRGNDTRGILTPVLQDQQPVVEQLIDR
jgi:hypothetical protein